jgi:hypothetical protein
LNAFTNFSCVMVVGSHLESVQRMQWLSTELYIIISINLSNLMYKIFNLKRCVLYTTEYGNNFNYTCMIFILRETRTTLYVNGHAGNWIKFSSNCWNRNSNSFTDTNSSTRYGCSPITQDVLTSLDWTLYYNINKSFKLDVQDI